MSPLLSEFSFKKPPKNISYKEGVPMKLSNELSFFHNKNRFRKELTRLQLLLKNYINQTLPASGIRDTYLKEDYTEHYLIVILTDNETIKNADKIVKVSENITIKPECFYIESKDNYLLLLTKDMAGLISGIDYLEDIFTQILEDYIKQKNFEEYIQIRQFVLSNC